MNRRRCPCGRLLRYVIWTQRVRCGVCHRKGRSLKRQIGRAA